MAEIQHFLHQTQLKYQALDYSVVAIDILNKIAKEKGLPIKSQLIDVRKFATSIS